MTLNGATPPLEAVAAAAGYEWMREATEDAAARSLDCLEALGAELLDALQSAQETDAERWGVAETALLKLEMLGVVSIEDLRSLNALHAWAESVSQRDLPHPLKPMFDAYVFTTRTIDAV